MRNAATALAVILLEVGLWMLYKPTAFIAAAVLIFIALWGTQRDR